MRSIVGAWKTWLMVGAGLGQCGHELVLSQHVGWDCTIGRRDKGVQLPATN